MPIADLQRRITEVGRIRLGRKILNSKGREMADRLDTFRFTSAAQHLIEEISALYGGQIEQWDGGKGKQWQVITTSNVVPIYVPPQKIDPFYELWGNGVCNRRCDGLRDVIRDEPCVCNPDERKCKPTTRVNVMLADVQGIGVWRLETHSIYGAGELAQLADLIRGIQVPLPGRLMLEHRGSKRYNRETGKVETLDYNVPVILFDAVTSRHLAMGGDAISQALRLSHGAAIEAPAAVQAVQAAPAHLALQAAPPAVAQPPVAAGPDPAMVQRALAAIRAAAPEQMQDIHQRIVKMGSPSVVVAAFQERLGQQELAARYNRQHNAQAATAEDPWADTQDTGPESFDPGTAPVPTPEPEQPPAPLQAPPEPPNVPEGPVEPQTAPAGDRQAVLTRLLGLAGTKGINRKQLEERLQSDYEVGLKTATVQQLEALAAVL